MSLQRTAPFWLVILLFFITVSAEAQYAASSLYKPFASFRVIKTEYFDIIFPSESESSARTLAEYADSFYKQLSNLFDVEIPYRIPVTFTPHTDMFNGYYNPIPSSHIVLYDTPMDLEWTNFSNSLEGLFIHELTHAVTLNTRGSSYKGLRRVFGNWASPSFINATAFMVEGVTVTIESLSGFGRANDPLVKQKLRQAIHEGKFLTPFQASSVYDRPGQSGSWYTYGGLFSTWLIRNYGMEKYTELWQEMGKLTLFSFVVYRSGYYRIFKKVYGIDFLYAWDAFKESFKLNDLEENPNELLAVKYHFFTKRSNSIAALASKGNNVFVLDDSNEKIIVYNTQTEKTRSFNTDFFSSYDLDVNSDGSALLVSGYRTISDRYSAFVTEQNTSTGRKTGRSIRGLYKARYFRDGVIGLRSELHKNCIVFDDFNGNSNILFRGNSGLVFSGPQALDDERIVFIAAQKGERELLLYNYLTKELFRIESANGENEYWRYMRGLGVSDGKLFFSHNADDRMYKLAFIDLDAMQAVFSRRDFSGGVFNPVSANDNVYYSGTFFYGDNFLRFPDSLSKIDENQATVIALSLIKINNEDYGFINPDSILIDNLVSPNNIEENINFNNQYEFTPSKPYFGIAYMNPFKFWLPLPLLRYSINFNNFRIRADGFGIFTVMMDPTDRNLIILTAFADIRYGMAMFDSFSWQSTIPGFPISLEFSDKVVTDTITKPYRETRVNLSGSIRFYPGRWMFGLSLNGGYLRIANDSGQRSAYQWEKTGSLFYYGASLSFSNNIRRQNELFGTGFSFYLRGISITDTFSPRGEAMFQANFETRFPVRVALYGAYDKIGMNINGVSRSYGQPLFANFASKEYVPSGNFYINWIAGGEISVGIFSFEIQKNISHLYFNRIFCTLSVRNMLYDSNNHQSAEGVAIDNLRLAQSLVLNFKLVSSIIPIKSVPFFLEPQIWGAWKFSNTITKEGSQLAWGFNFNFRY